MRVGFLVGSVSRQAGGLFQSVRGLAKAVASTNADVRVFGIRDEQSAVDLQEWRPTRFSWPRIGEQMRAVYKWVLGGGKTPETVRLCEHGTS